MKKPLILMLVLLAIQATNAQELTLPANSQYLADNPFVLSPTYAGIGDHIKIRANGLIQWTGIQNAPRTQSLAADMRMGNKSGIGILFFNDKNGNTRQYGARLSFAHHLTIDHYDDHFISFGLSYNYNQFKIETANFINAESDPILQRDGATTNHNFDLGVLYRIKNFYLSLNGGNILGKNADDFGDTEPLTLTNIYAYSGIKIRKTKRSKLEFEPSMFFQYFVNEGRSSTDFNLKARWYNLEDYYWAGVSYRFLNDRLLDPVMVGPMGGIKKNNIFFAYSYQISLNDLLAYEKGTHLITIGLNIFQGISNCRCTF